MKKLGRPTQQDLVGIAIEATDEDDSKAVRPDIAQEHLLAERGLPRREDLFGITMSFDDIPSPKQGN
jgi:hypothetical protein